MSFCIYIYLATLSSQRNIDSMISIDKVHAMINTVHVNQIGTLSYKIAPINHN